MSRSAGPGSPVWFMCPVLRRIYPRDRYDEERHRVRLTGRTRPFRSSKGSALGLRSTDTSREYRCSCGHVGWSAHVDLARWGDG